MEGEAGAIYINKPEKQFIKQVCWSGKEGMVLTDEGLNSG